MRKFFFPRDMSYDIMSVRFKHPSGSPDILRLLYNTETLRKFASRIITGSIIVSKKEPRPKVYTTLQKKRKMAQAMWRYEVSVFFLVCVLPSLSVESSSGFCQIK